MKFFCTYLLVEGWCRWCFEADWWLHYYHPTLNNMRVCKGWDVYVFVTFCMHFFCGSQVSNKKRSAGLVMNALNEVSWWHQLQFLLFNTYIHGFLDVCIFVYRRWLSEKRWILHLRSSLRLGTRHPEEKWTLQLEFQIKILFQTSCQYRPSWAKFQISSSA